MFDFRRVADLDAIAAYPERRAIKELMVLSEPLVFSNRVAINAFAFSQRLPTMHSLREYVVDAVPDRLIFHSSGRPNSRW